MSDSISHTSPGPRDLYILTLAVVAGLLLGPFMLGRLHQPTYNRLFVGVDPVKQIELEAATAEYVDKRQRLQATGVTPDALIELDDNHAATVEPLVAAMARDMQKHTYGLWQLLGALVVAVLAIMVIEAVVSAHRRAGLVTARYAILSVWVTIALAQPTMLAELPLLFTLLLIGVAVAAALVPLHRRA